MGKRFFFLLLALLLCLNGCSAAPEDPSATQTTPETTAPPATEATRPPTAETAAQPTLPPLTLHSGLREDGSFTEGTLFIGDSLTYAFVGNYLEGQGLLGDARYTAQCGSQITAFFDGTIVSHGASRYNPEFSGMEFSEAAASMGENATAIYIMWGTNYTPGATAQDYVDIVDFLLENCPNATIHLQTVPFGEIIAFQTVNERILAAYAHYQETGEDRVFLIDTYTTIGRHTVDGVHLDDTGYGNWYRAIVDHAAANDLSA